MPTPLLIAVAQNDVLTPTKLAIDAYVNGFAISSGVQSDWFRTHLMNSGV